MIDQLGLSIKRWVPQVEISDDGLMAGLYSASPTLWLQTGPAYSRDSFISRLAGFAPGRAARGQSRFGESEQRKREEELDGCCQRQLGPAKATGDTQLSVGRLSAGFGL